MPFHGLDYRLREFRRVRRFREYGNGLAMGQSMAAAATTGFGADWPGEPPGLAQHTRLQLAQLREEMAVAAAVQRNLLPPDEFRLPPYEVAAAWVPCFALAGDFYDLIHVGDCVAVVVGDVAGKGLPASLLMASVRASLRAYVEAFTEGFDQLGRMMQRLNVCLARDAQQGGFATLFLGVLCPRRRRLWYCSAGHEPALLLGRGRSGRCERLDVGGYPLGVEADAVYETEALDLQPGDVLAAFSDGIPEARNGAGEMFGRPAAAAALRHDGQTACQIRDRLLGDVRSFSDPVRQTDDTTLVVVRVEA
jgi:phosphoserine phosphatase RsbU/P